MKRERDDLPAERLRELLNYDPKTGIFTWRIDRRAKARPGSLAGTITPSGYRNIWTDGYNYRAHRLAWLYVYGKWPAGQIDHINRVRSDNRIANLRIVTHAQNMENRKVQRNNTSGYTGVYPDRDGRRFSARISSNGKWLYLGHFKTAELAYAAYCKAAAELHTHNPAANDSHRSAA